MTLLSNLFQAKTLKTSVPKFWAWFSENSDTVFAFEKDQHAVEELIAAELHKVHPHLTFEIGPDVEDVRELIISADGFKDAIPAVEEVVKQAPQSKQWKVVAFRQPVPMLMTAYYGNVILPPEDLWFSSVSKAGKWASTRG